MIWYMGVDGGTGNGESVSATEEYRLAKPRKICYNKKVNICESEDLIWHLTETTSPKTESGE